MDFLLKQISLIKHDLANKSYEEFEKSDLLVRATAFSLAQIGEQMNKLDKVFKDHYPELPWGDARRMRNIIFMSIPKLMLHRFIQPQQKT